MGLCLEIGFVRLKDIVHVGLWVQINKREPGALYLNLQFVPLFNGMEHILKLNVYIGFLVGREGLRVRKAISEPAAKHLAPHP